MLTATERQIILKYRRLDIRGKCSVEGALENAFRWSIKENKIDQPQLYIIKGGQAQ